MLFQLKASVDLRENRVTCGQMDVVSEKGPGNGRGVTLNFMQDVL
jgi:hypothetical protein